MNHYHKYTIILFCLLVIPFLLPAQQHKVSVINNEAKQKVIITIDGKPFTEFVYTDTMEKPFLYPIYAPNGQTITRGFPWNPLPNDPVDHPHHIGLWFAHWVHILDKERVSP